MTESGKIGRGVGFGTPAGEVKKVVRTDTPCPNCMKKKLLEGLGDLWCDECGQQYERVGKAIRFKN